MSSITRRELLAAAVLAAAARAAETQRVPLKIGHRAASMKMVGDFGVFRVARGIPGPGGVELHIAQG